MAEDWQYCTTFEETLDDWSIHVPSGTGFVIELQGEMLRLHGDAAEPEFAPQIVLSPSLRPSMENVLEVVAWVDVHDLGAVLALDIDDEDDRYNWSLDVSASLVSFGYVDSTCDCGSGWTRLSQLDEIEWNPDVAEGQHALRIIFDGRTVRAYVDGMRVASFGLPEDLRTAVVRVSVDPKLPPEGDAKTIDYTDVRVLRLCFGGES